MILDAEISFTTPTGRTTLVVPHSDRLSVSQPAFDAALAEAARYGNSHIAYRFSGRSETSQRWVRTWVAK